MVLDDGAVDMTAPVLVGEVADADILIFRPEYSTIRVVMLIPQPIDAAPLH